MTAILRKRDPRCRTRVPGEFGALAVASIGALLGFAFAPTCSAQAAGVNQAGPAYIHGQVDSSSVPKQAGTEAAAQVEAMRAAERRRLVLADTAKLLELSNELKTEVDRAGKDQLSLAVMRKAAEIEKVARDLKERLRY